MPHVPGQSQFFMDEEALTKWCRENWYKLDQSVREAIVAMLRKELKMDSFRKEMDKNPYGWCSGYWHFGQGMAVRNLLREKGFSDNILPEKCDTWDDVYTAALEAAAGVIET